MSQQKEAYQLLKLFDTYYKAKYGEQYRGNRHADKWGFMDMVEDLTFDGAVDVIEYYFKTNPRGGHTRKHLMYHYHEYADTLDKLRKDKAMKRKILKRMREQYEG